MFLQLTVDGFAIDKMAAEVKVRTAHCLPVVFFFGTVVVETISGSCYSLESVFSNSKYK